MGGRPMLRYLERLPTVLAIAQSPILGAMVAKASMKRLPRTGQSSGRGRLMRRTIFLATACARLRGPVLCS